VKLLVALLLIAAAAVGAIAANLALLTDARANNDPVGKLTPHAFLPAAPAQVLRPVNTPPDNEGADD
jgi:hypothetical protein